MHEEPDNIESLLLDLHLGRLDAEQGHRVERALAKSPELAARSQALSATLGRLDMYEVPEPPETLADAVMARIDEQTQPLSFEKAASVVPAGSAHDLSGSPALSLRELIAIAACITLFVGIFVPGYRKAQNIAQRNLCRNNIRLIAQGMNAYTQENDGYLPWTGHVPQGSWLATRTPNVPRYSNSRSLFALLRNGYISDRGADVFLCPSDPDARPMLADDYTAFDDFAEPVNVSYSSQLMNVPHPRRAAQMDPRMVLIADRNPLFDRRSSSHHISPYDQVGNSFTHEAGAGQNAMYLGGQGGWFTEPTIGVNRDHIYRVGKLIRYQGTETLSSPTDTMLVP